MSFDVPSIVQVAVTITPSASVFFHENSEKSKILQQLKSSSME
jgi:hypothetical protein